MNKKITNQDILRYMMLQRQLARLDKTMELSLKAKRPSIELAKISDDAIDISRELCKLEAKLKKK